MANPNPSPLSRRKPKDHKKKSIKLQSKLCPIAENSLKNATETIELGLAIVEFLANQAAIGNIQAIELLAQFGVEVQATKEHPIVVHRSVLTAMAINDRLYTVSQKSI